jgi:hypothetical protein
MKVSLDFPQFLMVATSLKKVTSIPDHSQLMIRNNPTSQNYTTDALFYLWLA